MPTNAFTPSKLDVVNLALTSLGVPPVGNISESDYANTIALRLNFLLPDLLTVCDWKFALKYVTENVPLTTPFTTEYLYSYQLPPDYGRLWQVWKNEANQPFLIADGFISTNAKPIQYYYVVNNVDYDVLTPPFTLALGYYVAWDVCLALTQNVTLKNDIRKSFDDQLRKAVNFNSMEAFIKQTPHNDFNRLAFI